MLSTVAGRRGQGERRVQRREQRRAPPSPRASTQARMLLDRRARPRVRTTAVPAATQQHQEQRARIHHRAGETFGHATGTPVGAAARFRSTAESPGYGITPSADRVPAAIGPVRRRTRWRTTPCADRPLRLLALLCGAALALAGCAAAGAAAGRGRRTPRTGRRCSRQPAGRPLDWYIVHRRRGGQRGRQGLRRARGWRREFGVTLNVVPVADTADAVNKVLAERQAGRAGSGTVDAIWINGENFATGRQADLWYCGYPARCPTRATSTSPTRRVATDFGRAGRGLRGGLAACRTRRWSTTAPGCGPPTSRRCTALEDWARANPGRFTYPAPPDFTGSMVVRTFLYDTAGDPSALPEPFDAAAFAPLADRLWARLNGAGARAVAGRADLPDQPGRGRAAVRDRRDRRLLHLRAGHRRVEGRRRRLPGHDPHGRARHRQHRQHQLPGDPGGRRRPGRRRWCWRTCCRTRRPSCGSTPTAGSTRRSTSTGCPPTSAPGSPPSDSARRCCRSRAADRAGAARARRPATPTPSTTGWTAQVLQR